MTSTARSGYDDVMTGDALAEAAHERFWRSLDEAGVDHDARRSLPVVTSHAADGPLLGRRDFMKLMAASLALAGGGCSRPPLEKIVPYVHGPREIEYGKPLYFATALCERGYATGVLVESNMGRPTKVEGNPRHPASLGSTGILEQARALELWDPDRSQTVIKSGQITTWDAFLVELRSAMTHFAARGGAGLRILTETVTSPSLAAQLDALLERYPQARWHQYEPLNRDNVYAGSTLAFGRPLETRYQFDQARVVLALDADFLGSLPGHVRYARDFVSLRRVETGQRAMNRLYAVESAPSLTGASADHRLALRAGDVGAFTRALASRLRVTVGPAGSASASSTYWLDAAAEELLANRGASLVVVGDEQPPEVHALAHRINHALGNAGKTVVHTQPVAAAPVNQLESLRALCNDMAAGQVELLVIVGGNPVYNAPADLDFSAALKRVRTAVHLSLYQDETSAQCQWHVAAAHSLEAWGDARAFDGSVTLLQPLIAPLYDGKSAHDLIAAMNGELYRSGYDIVRGYWQSQHAGPDFERFWQSALHAGWIEGSAFPTQTLPAPQAAEGPPSDIGPADASPLEIVFRADPCIRDGSYANNAWLQELPKPLTQLTWDNAALISLTLAKRLGLANEDTVDLKLGERSVRAPVWITPGHPDDSVTVYLGYGRSRAGRVGTSIGFDAYVLRTSAAPWFASGLELSKADARYPLATVQQHHRMEGRDIVRVATLAQLRAQSSAESQRQAAENPTLYAPFDYPGYAWGMSINLTTCIGCNACTIACQAENNIPTVGKAEVARGREMHWIRVDRYYQGTVEEPRTSFQPVPCMHCERAPCEIVCPVEAAVHDSEGLNVQVYNRCVGTRFCSNNCPYKVRRFNFFQYSKDIPSLNAQRNPEVTVRMRGVMEKCTYCLQRISNARIEADREDRRLRDGEVVTACQAVCPTQAIVFGDLNDSQSAVNKAKSSPLDYALLKELNTKPRTTYLAKVTNPNPKLGEAGGGSQGAGTR